MKKRIFALVISMALMPIPFVNAHEEIDVYYDGERIEFDAAPEILNDRTFVPIRAIAEALGTDVAWDGETETVTLAKSDVVTYLVIGTKHIKTKAKGHESTGDIDAAPYIKNKRTMVPLRFISETFGMDVIWDGDTRSVYITTPTGTPEPTAAPKQTAEPTQTPADQTTEKPEPAETENPYAKMYEGTEYEFVRNLDKLTFDFEQDESKYRSGKHWGKGTDADGNGVMYIVRDVNKKDVKSEVEFLLDKYTDYNKEEFIDISFDLYVPTSFGYTTVSLVGPIKQENTLFTLENKVRSGLVFKLLAAIDFPLGVYDELSAPEYFNNNASEDGDIAIRNGAHVNVFINPYRGTMTTTIKNNTNDAEPIVLKDYVSLAVSNQLLTSSDFRNGESAHFLETRARLYGIKIVSRFNEASKSVIFDNLVTNIVKKAE